MDHIAKSIIDIDNHTQNMKNRYKALMVEKEDEFKNKIVELEKRYQDESIKEGEKVYQEIINKTISAINARGRDMVNYDINNTYNKLKKDLIESIWTNLFLSKE